MSLKLVPPVKNSGYGSPQRKWNCKHWEGQWQDETVSELKRIVVCQIPHMTYYDIDGDYSKNEGVAEWPKAVVKEGVRG